MPVAKQELKKFRININYQYYKKLFYCIDMEQISHFARVGIEVCKLKYTNIHHQWDIDNCKSLAWVICLWLKSYFYDKFDQIYFKINSTNQFLITLHSITI